jgi:hypothetical protein
VKVYLIELFDLGKWDICLSGDRFAQNVFMDLRSAVKELRIVQRKWPKLKWRVATYDRLVDAKRSTNFYVIRRAMGQMILCRSCDYVFCYGGKMAETDLPNFCPICGTKREDAMGSKDKPKREKKKPKQLK